MYCIYNNIIYVSISNIKGVKAVKIYTIFDVFFVFRKYIKISVKGNIMYVLYKEINKIGILTYVLHSDIIHLIGINTKGKENRV